MEVAGRLPNDGESDKAAKFYEQALLLVDCCKIPEAIKLLEKAIELNPDSEVYKETLAFFQMNAECYTDHLAKDKQGLSYATVTRAKSKAGNEKEKSSPEWNVEKTRLKDDPSAKMPWSPAVSSSYYSDPYEQATIENPWASFVGSNYRRKKTDSSPIDGLSEIELPSMNEYKMESPHSKEDYKQQVEEHTDSSFSSMLKTPISSQETIGEDGSSFGREHEKNADISADHLGYKNGVYPEGINRYNDSQDENLEARFLEELCTARETAIDDWAKYYDLLRSGLKEGVSSTQADSLGQNVSNTQNSDSLDEVDEFLGVRNRKSQPSFDQTASKSNNKVCSKCGHFSGSGNLPPSPTKNRIHFVNGACVSSSNYSYCTCNKQNKVNSERQSPRSHLSLSQQEFYRNLQSYFGNGKVKSRKTTMDGGKDSSSDDVDLHSATRCNSHDTNISSNATKESPITSNQNVMESEEDSAVQSENRTSKEHASHEAKNEASSFTEWVRKDKKSLGEERFQQGFKSKSKLDEKVKGRPRGSKTEHAKNAKEGASRIESQRQARPKVGVKSRVSHKVKAEDTTRTVPATDVKEKPSKYRTEEIAQADINFTKLFYGLYCTGISLLSKSGRAFKSIIYYLILLLVLLFGFVIYCVWFACCWLCRKVLHFIPADRWLALVRNKGSALYEWCRKYRETRKVSGQGQTYDLPKNGDAAVIHMLQNKDSDPYSVLGVPRDAIDDDIRKQYRKLAVLIHPDKNTHPHADEAFKTLANAFDILSDPVKRSNFDAEEAWKRRAEEAHYGPTTPEQFFADLGRKMQEMQNYLHCNACDGKHRRYRTDRFVLTARYCSRCSTRHAAKEGDLWAESSFLGYKLHFYACMEGEVFDVTDWAACQGIGSYRVEPNPHTVHLKLKTRQTHPSGFNSRSEEKDFENFMRQFFGQFPSERERCHGTSKPQKRRRKKKH